MTAPAKRHARPDKTVFAVIVSVQERPRRRVNYPCTYVPDGLEMSPLRRCQEALDIHDERRLGYQHGLVRRVLADVVVADEGRLHIGTGGDAVGKCQCADE